MAARGLYEARNGKDKPVGKSGKVGSGYDAEFRGYINVNLLSAEKERFDAWAASASYPETLNAAVGDGINLSLKVDVKNSCYLASATQRREKSVNAGLVVTARADSPDKALARVCYILAILGRKERWEDTQPVADPDRW